jgi:hypothetical protein
MGSNFLGDFGAAPAWRGIISSNELLAREGVDLRKGMNFRKEPLLSVFLVLPCHDGEYRDSWDEKKGVYIYEGHDSTTVEGGKAIDQIAMYPDGRLSDNGKFLKMANAYTDGIRREPMHIQVYEKLDPGVWYDKGIFNLIDAQQVKEGGRKVFKFHLRPVDAVLNASERMIPITKKVAAWEKASGRCEKCKAESDLHFVEARSVHLYCAKHR